jgi:hypothetical protein
MGTWRDRPRHDSNSHAADAMRYLAVAFRELAPAVEPVPVYYSPSDKPIPQKPRGFKVLSEYTYQEFHEATGSEIGKKRKHRYVRV